MIEIREEQPPDIAGIHNVNRMACRPQEADLVDRLRANDAVLLSLVAVDDGRVIGHILYTRATVGDVVGAGLGPMSVLPERQRQGIGSKLIEAGTQLLAGQGCPFIVVLGHAAYYPKFGFKPASTRGITCTWKVPDDVFLVLVLNEHTMRGVSGEAKYREEFSSVT